MEKQAKMLKTEPKLEREIDKWRGRNDQGAEMKVAQRRCLEFNPLHLRR